MRKPNLFHLLQGLDREHQVETGVGKRQGRGAALDDHDPAYSRHVGDRFGRERHDLRRQRRRRAALGRQDAGRRDLNPENPRCRKARRQQQKIKSGARSHFQNGARGQFLDGPHQQQQVHALRSHGSGEECPLPPDQRPRDALWRQPLGQIEAGPYLVFVFAPHFALAAPATGPARPIAGAGAGSWPLPRCAGSPSATGDCPGKPPRGSTEKRLSISSSLTWIIKAPERAGHGGRPHYLTLSVACPSDRPRPIFR